VIFGDILLIMYDIIYHTKSFYMIYDNNIATKIWRLLISVIFISGGVYHWNCARAYTLLAVHAKR